MSLTRRRVLRSLLFSPLLLVLLLLVLLTAERIRGKVSLAQYRKVLVSRGARLKPADLRTPFDAKDNGAPLFFEAADRITNGSVISDLLPPMMKLTPAGDAAAGFLRTKWVSWVSDKVTNSWPDLARELATNSSALKQARAALGQRVLNNQLDYTAGFKMSFGHLLPAKRMAQIFGASTQLSLHNGKLAAATDDLVAQIQITRLLEQDQLLISELVRIAIAAIGRTCTWEALQAEGWTDEDLARLQQTWEATSFIPPVGRSLEGERVFSLTTYEKMRQSNSVAVSVLYWRDYFNDGEENGSPWHRTAAALPAGEAIARFLRNEVYCRVWRFAWLDQCERHYLEYLDQLLEVYHTAERDKTLREALPEVERVVDAALPLGFYDRLRFQDELSISTLGPALKKAMQAETERSLVIAAIALKRFELKHGAPPPSLEKLVPGFIKSIPIDYMCGQPLRYRLRENGKPLLYSVGTNGKDEGGDASHSNQQNSPAVIWGRKDVVWPARAILTKLQ